MAFLTSIWNGFLSLGGIIFPVSGNARGWKRALRWACHVVVLALVLVGLWYLNWFFDLEKALRSPWPTLHKVWLPLLFLLLYFLFWLVYWLWKLLGPEREASEFPDIDEAWEEALAGLNQANIDVTEPPLFLILGQPAGSEEALFNAARLPLGVKQTPRRADAPLHLYANREGIYVTCAGSSLLGRHASHLSREALGAGRAPLPSSAPAGAVQNILARAKKEGRGPEQMTDDEKQLLGSLVAQEAPDSAPVRALGKNKELIELFTARLQHLCGLIVRARRPYCPVNGMLVLVPLVASNSDQEASQTATLCQQDLLAARRVLQVDCPIFVLVCDLEKAPGFGDFIELLPEEQRSRAMGRRFPLVPDLDPPEVPHMIESGMHWLCQSLLPSHVYNLFDLGAGNSVPFSGMSASVGRNARLYQLVSQVRDRRKRLSRIVARIAQLDDGSVPMVGGCYLAGTGFDAVHEQAFVPEVFHELLQNQSYVSWSPQALAEEMRYRRWTSLAFGGLVLLIIALVVLGILSWVN